MKYKFSSIALLLSIVLFSGCGSDQQTAIDDSAARSNFEKGNYEVAIVEYKKVLQSDPQHFDSIRNLGIIFAEQGLPQEALPLLLKGRELQPDDLTLRLKLASVYTQMGGLKEAVQELDFVLSKDRDNELAPILLAENATTQTAVDEARATLNRLQTWHPSSASIITAQGILLMKEGKLAEAIVKFEDALSKDENLYQAHFYLGLSYTQSNQPEEVDKHLKRAAELAPVRSPKKLLYAQSKLQAGEKELAKGLINEILEAAPDYLPASILMAQVEAADKNYDEALQLLSNVTYRYPIHPEALLGLGKVNLELGKHDEAIAKLKTLTTVHKNSPEAYYLIAIAEVAKENLDTAKENLVQQLSVNPNHFLATSLLVNINAQLGTPEDSISVLEKTISASPNSVPTKLLLANTYAGINDSQKALELISELENAYPSNPIVLYNKGRINLSQGSFDEAKESLSEALELGGYARDASLLLARAYHETGDLPECVEALKPILENNPEDQEALFMIALTSQRLGEYTLARDYYESIIDLNPNHIGVLNNLSMLYLESLNDIELAEKHARRARELLPDDPAIADTFGWVLYKKGEYGEAEKIITAQTDHLKHVPEFLYHLGLCHYVFGNEQEALENLSEALVGDNPFAETGDCRERVKVLKINPEAANEDDIEYLKNRTASRTDETFAWLRLAQIYSKLGDEAQAESAKQEVLKINREFNQALFASN